MSPPPVIEVRGFGKTFGGRTVLHDVDLTVSPGEIHGLVGQNGSGKSTLIKILAGYHAPDAGASLRVNGRTVDLPLPPDAPARLGLRFVHQDLGLLETGAVIENLLVGNYQTGALWRISWGAEHRRATAILERFGLTVAPSTPIKQLNEVERTIVAIARAMAGLHSEHGGLLVLDEPTSRLPRDAVSTFFDAVRDVAGQGFGVLFVSHRLDEILGLVHQVTVLRDGAAVARRSTTGLDAEVLVGDILGFRLDELYPEPHHAKQQTVLRAHHVSGGTVQGLNLALHRGEILGVTGLLGMGHNLLPHLLFGSVPASEGTLEVDGRRYDLRHMTPRRAMEAGIALLPANRLRDSGVAQAGVAENMTLATLSTFRTRGFLRHRREERAVREMMRLFAVQPEAPRQPLATLSGGNQQKALLAKWFARDPMVFLLDEPTHGVDVGAKKQIFKHIRDAAEAGKAILVSSVEGADLAQLCDRVLVFRDGRAVSDLHGTELTEARINEQVLVGRASVGGSREPPGR